MFEELLTRFRSGSYCGGIIGLGYVGLPLADTFVSKGIRVIGFDVDPSKVKSLNSGQSYIQTVSSDKVTGWRRASRFEATSDMQRLAEPDALLICVPTPLTDARDPDLQYVEQTERPVANRVSGKERALLSAKKVLAQFLHESLVDQTHE